MSWPQEIEQATRIASVPLALRLVVRRLGPIELLVTLGPDAAFFRTLPQLLKLGTLEPQSFALRSDTGAPATTVVLTREGERVELAWETLNDPFENLLLGALQRLVGQADAVTAAHELALELARVEALHAVVSTMLAAPKLDQALSAFLAGVTSGAGLGFHRAALFVLDPARRVFVGAHAIGPADEAEAHRIWESVEAESVSFEKQLARAKSQSAFADRVRQVALVASEGDELARALAGHALFFSRPEGPTCERLRELDPAKEFVLAKIAVRDHTLGLLYADMRFGDGTVPAGVVSHLTAFIAQAGVAWETLRLLKEVQELARTDPLTGLPNRREFEARFTQERSRIQRSGESLSLLLVDLDHFREINNEKGHEAGDTHLRTVGKILRGALRTNDVCARFGGDEFVVLLPGAGALEAALVCRRIGVAAHRRGISFSVGAASYPEDCDHPDDLVGIADKNLFAAKDAGRGRASLAGESAPLVFAEEDEVWVDSVPPPSGSVPPGADRRSKG